MSVEEKHYISALLVEDFESDATLFRKMLERMDHAFCFVKSVSRLDEALDFLHKNSVDIVLSDLNLPDSSGIKTFEAIHQTAPAIPIVILTGTDDTPLCLEAVHHGAQDYIVKPEIAGKIRMLNRIVLLAIERNAQLQDLNRLVSQIKEMACPVPA